MRVTVDVAGAQMGGAARFAAELYDYLARAERDDVQVIGATRRLDAPWLVRRELVHPAKARRIAINNVSFVAPGGDRWTMLRNALYFLTASEAARLDPSLRARTAREAVLVRLAARRADVLVVPSMAMADRVKRILPGVRSRIMVRPHPVSADVVPQRARESAILCPVLFAPYKHMAQRLEELLKALQDYADPVWLQITADRCDVPPPLANNPRAEFVGRLDHRELRELWARSRAIYFPTGLEAFGYPLAEARVSGRPVIARDNAQNREIAGPALCGFSAGDHESLVRAVSLAMTTHVTPDPRIFDPQAYFDWMLGAAR